MVYPSSRGTVQTACVDAAELPDNLPWHGEASGHKNIDAAAMAPFGAHQINGGDEEERAK